MKTPVETIESNLAALEKCLRRLDCDMGLTDEEHGEQMWKAGKAIAAIRRATKKIRDRDRNGNEQDS